MKSHLLRMLGAGFGLAVILGATVGGEILRLPDPGGIFRAPLFPWTPGLCLLVSLALLAGCFAADGRLALAALGLLVLAWPLFRWTRRGRQAVARDPRSSRFFRRVG